MLFFDLETTSEYEHLENLKINNRRKYNIFLKHCKIKRTYGDVHYLNSTDEELYEHVAPIMAEYGKIVCFSYGIVTIDTDNMPKYHINSVFSKNEKEIIDYIYNVFNKIGNRYNLCGYNIKNFDIPWLCRKMLQYGYELPLNIRIVNKKPWEITAVDIKELWKFGGWQTAIFDEVLCLFGLDDPKVGMDGSDVYNEYWINDNLEGIKTYCEKDVKGCMDLLLTMSGKYTYVK